MKHPSAAFDALVAARKVAKRIVSGVPKNDLLTDTHELKVRAYTILLHAAVEEYLEAVCLEAVNYSLSKLNADQKVNVPLYCLIGFYKTAYWWHSEGASAAAIDIIGKVASDVVDTHKKTIDNVHGIRHNNQNALFLPVGINLQNYDTVLSSALESFGVKRGAVAHNMSIRIKDTKSIIDGDMTTIVGLLKSFDEDLGKLCQRHVEA